MNARKCSPNSLNTKDSVLLAMSKWIGTLGSLHQFRGVPYVTIADDGDVCCELCETGWMSYRQRVDHFHGTRHCNNYRRVQELEKEHRREQAQLQEIKVQFQLLSTRLKNSKSWDGRIEKLGLRQWQDAIKAVLFDYCHGNASISDIPTLLSKYEMKERLSLLEIALWKSSILSRGEFDKIQDVREYTILDPKFQPAVYLEKARVLSGAATIVPLVLSYMK